MAAITGTQRLRRIVPAALVAAAATLGGSALASPTTACAAPDTGGGGREWDVGAYDTCLEGGITNDANFDQHEQWCCHITGGDWNKAKRTCQAPPAEPAQVPNQILLPGQNIATLTPVAPASPVPPAPPSRAVTPVR